MQHKGTNPYPSHMILLKDSSLVAPRVDMDKNSRRKGRNGYSTSTLHLLVGERLEKLRLVSACYSGWEEMEEEKKGERKKGQVFRDEVLYTSEGHISNFSHMLIHMHPTILSIKFSIVIILISSTISFQFHNTPQISHSFEFSPLFITYNTYHI